MPYSGAGLTSSDVTAAVPTAAQIAVATAALVPSLLAITGAVPTLAQITALLAAGVPGMRSAPQQGRTTTTSSTSTTTITAVGAKAYVIFLGILTDGGVGTTPDMTGVFVSLLNTTTVMVQRQTGGPTIALEWVVIDPVP